MGTITITTTSRSPRPALAGGPARGQLCRQLAEGVGLGIHRAGRIHLRQPTSTCRFATSEWLGQEIPLPRPPGQLFPETVAQTCSIYIEIYAQPRSLLSPAGTLRTLGVQI